MNITVLTLFPEIIEGYINASIMAKAREQGLISVETVQIRDYAFDRHKTCDDAPYGGGAGMVLKPEPLGLSLDSVEAKGKRVLYPTPSGRLFSQAYAADLAQQKELVFICGRYEGIDQRIIDEYVTDEISIGDYVISSGEIASLVILDGIYRLLGGVISRESLEEESFSKGLLEYPHYTRPAEFHGMQVPEILLSGHHREIERWRLRKQVEKTVKYRPELLEKVDINEEIRNILVELELASKGE